MPFFCPKHGQVAEASKYALVECHCGSDCAPEGVTTVQHKQAYYLRRRVGRHRRQSVTPAIPQP